MDSSSFYAAVLSSFSWWQEPLSLLGSTELVAGVAVVVPATVLGTLEVFLTEVVADAAAVA